MRIAVVVAGVLALAGWTAGDAAADEIELTSGVILDGEAKVVGEEVQVLLASGGRMTLPRRLVKDVRVDGTPAAALAPAPLPVPSPAPAPSAVPAPPPASPTDWSGASVPRAPVSSPPPPPTSGGVVYPRQGIHPYVVESRTPAPCAAPSIVSTTVCNPCATPAVTCTPCAKPCEPDPCDPCGVPCPDLGPWSFAINLCWTMAGGNSDSLAFKVDFEVVYEKDPWKWETKGFYAYAESGGSVDTNRIFVESQLRREIDECSYAFVGGSYDKDEPADLDYRVIANVGYGRSLIKKENTTLDLEAGIGGTWEKRTNLPDDRLDPSAMLGLDYMRDWKRAGKLTIDYDFLPNLSDFDLSLMRADIKWTLPIWKCLNVSLGLRVDYQIEPEDPTVEEIDWIATAGLGIAF